MWCVVMLGNVFVVLFLHEIQCVEIYIPCAIWCAFLSKAHFTIKYTFFYNGKAVSCIKRQKEQYKQPTFCLWAKHVWFLPLMLRLLRWTTVQISTLSWKYGFLIHRYLGLNHFHQSWSLSRRLEWKQDTNSAGRCRGSSSSPDLI